MNSIWIARNLVQRALGNFRGILSYLILPVAVVSGAVGLLGGGISSPDAPIAYVNLDSGPAGERLLAGLAVREGRELQAEPDEAAIKRGVTDRDLQFGVVIPEGYSRALIEGGSAAPIYYQLNPTEDSMLLKLSVASEHKRLSDAAAVVREEAAESGSSSPEEVSGRFGELLEAQENEAVRAVVTDPQLYPKDGIHNVIGFTLLFLMGLAGTCVSLILEDRRQGTMARIFTAPAGSLQIALGNFLGCFVLGWLQIGLLLLVTRGVLRYDYGVPLWLHAAVLTAFMLVTIGLASALAGIVRNPDNAPMLNTFIITPTCMLGGCFWKISIMPDYLQTASNFMPQKWAIEAVQRVADGGGLHEAAMPLLILLLMAFVLLAIGSVILKPGERAA
ncbi:ABC transporter permease [Saccharibacillus qingshengii]|uniref:ABC transporter permease n=1 Tax=Saccharibacillus qingshengii TaxID=1763540 RepID=UPI001557627F|nr:ABC transporter permease [Saccharibacillus qingshengii]